MPFLNAFLHKGGKFLDLLEGFAKEIVLTSEDFESFMEAPSTSRHLELLKIHDLNEKVLIRKMETALLRTYLTELERQDILLLTEVMIRIPKTICLLAKHVITAGIHAQSINLSKQIVYINNSSEIIHSMINQLKDPHSIQRMRNLYRKIIRYYDRAEDDRVLLFQDLYSGQVSPIQAIALSQTYELSRIIHERIYSAALQIMYVAMKNY